MSRVFIGLGSNEGDRLEHISNALQALEATAGIRVVQMAMVSETAPMGGPPQGPYLNTVAEVEITLTPRELLNALQAIERQLGRQPTSQRWTPRPIDVDILLYDDLVVHEPDLVIPHPRMHERRFVLEPLCQLAPNIVHPILQKTAAALLEAGPATEAGTTAEAVVADGSAGCRRRRPEPVACRSADFSPREKSEFAAPRPARHPPGVRQCNP